MYSQQQTYQQQCPLPLMPQQLPQGLPLPQQHMQYAGGLRLLTYPNSKVKGTEELIAVIVTISGASNSSYDPMYAQVSQEGPEGTRIAVYQAWLGALPTIYTAIEKNGDVEKDENSDVAFEKSLAQLCKDIADVDADSVVFNWECCGACSDTNAFGNQTGDILKMIQLLVSRGFMVMCSDFSLKALIASWTPDSAPFLGPNPFKQLGVCNDSISLHFDPDKLELCPSTQLQKVGDLCSEGTATMHALSSTIVYSADKALADNSSYTMQVLTVVPAVGGFNIAAVPEQYKWTIDATDKISQGTGVCGHVLLSYSSGGKILTSAGHWIELVKLDVSEENLMRCAQQEYGDQYVMEMQQEMAQCRNATSRKAVVQQRAQRMVQSSAPMEYSKGWGRSKAGYKGGWQQRT